MTFRCCSSLLCLAVVASLASRTRFIRSGKVHLTLVRHGRSKNNIFPRQGPLGLVDPSLSGEGKRQATRLGKERSQQPKPDLVFCSCLLRAKETALLTFPDEIVHVAPHIVERSKTDLDLPEWLNPGDHWHSRELQEKYLVEDIGEQHLARLAYEDFGDYTCGPPDWDLFLKWLWSQPMVQDLITNVAEPHIAIVSHGNFLQKVLTRHGWKGGHPRNAQAADATLPYTEKGFGTMYDVFIEFPGYPGGDTTAKFYWLCIFFFMVFSCCGVCACRRYLSHQTDECNDADSISPTAASEEGTFL